MEQEVRENQAVTAEVNKLGSEKRQLQDMSKRLQFSLSGAEMANLSESDAARVAEIQQQLGVTPRGSIRAQNVREVRLYKDQQATRLGIIFHQNTPAELGDVSSDNTPRAGGKQPVVLPVIKVLDKAGIAGNCPDLHEGDQVLSVNGKAAGFKRRRPSLRTAVRGPAGAPRRLRAPLRTPQALSGGSHALAAARKAVPGGCEEGDFACVTDRQGCALQRADRPDAARRRRAGRAYTPLLRTLVFFSWAS